MKELIGYVVGWNDTPTSKMTGSGYLNVRADVTLNMEVFKQRSDAEIVLAAERLKTPTMDWEIFEVYRG